MFKKVHLRLTLLCAGITAVIMLVMSLCYLYVSEKGLYRNQFQAFKNDINTISTNLEQQSVISMEWLAKMEAQGNYRFFVLDNGVPFLYNQLSDPEQTEENNILFFTISKFNLQHGAVNWQTTIVNLMKVMERQAHLLHITKVSSLICVRYFTNPQIILFVTIVMRNHAFCFF